MAKLRVYELAKELKMTNKALLGKLKAMQIAVKSHASTLDKKTLEQVRNQFLGKQTDVKNVTDGKSAPVIRRRRKKAQDNYS